MVQFDILQRTLFVLVSFIWLSSNLFSPKRRPCSHSTPVLCLTQACLLRYHPGGDSGPTPGAALYRMTTVSPSSDNCLTTIADSNWIVTRKKLIDRQWVHDMLHVHPLCGKFYFPWHTYQIEGIPRDFSVSSERLKLCETNEIAYVSKQRQVELNQFLITIT